MEDEHDTDHSHHIGWVHHDDDNLEDQHSGGEHHEEYVLILSIFFLQTRVMHEGSFFRYI